jgi:toxin-antitoxin system PIN domain toxin
MRRLLDVNVLIALMDPDHAFHHRAHAWWSLEPRAWASCPLTENGLLRIMTLPSYSKTSRFTIKEIAGRLSLFTDTSDHQFWPDSISIREPSRFDHGAILSSKHLTDLYLLALASEHQGCLVTFDQHIPPAAVIDSGPSQLEVI